MCSSCVSPRVYLVDARQRGPLGRVVEDDGVLLLAGQMRGPQGGAQRAAGCGGGQRRRLEFHLGVLG